MIKKEGGKKITMAAFYLPRKSDYQLGFKKLISKDVMQ